MTRDRLKRLAESRPFRALGQFARSEPWLRRQGISGRRLKQGVLLAFEPLVPPEPGTQRVLFRGCVCGHDLLSHLKIDRMAVMGALQEVALGSTSAGEAQVVDRALCAARAPCPCRGCKAFSPRYPDVYRRGDDMVSRYMHFLRQHVGEAGRMDDVFLPADLQDEILSIMAEPKATRGGDGD